MDALDISEELVKIDINQVAGREVSPCNIYLKLASGKMIQIATKGELLNMDIVNKCNESLEVEVYMTQGEYNDFVKKSSEEAMSKIIPALKREQTVNRGKRIETQMMSMKFIRLSLKSFGITEKMMDLTNETINSVMYTVDNMPMIKTIMNDLMERGEFFQQKALMMSYLGTFTMAKSPLNGDINRQKLCMAAYLHDFKLSDHTILGTNFEEVNIGKIESTDIFKEYKSHALKEGEYLQHSEQVPLDVINLVRNHHAPITKDDEGFCDYISSELSTLEQVFIVSHDLSIELLNKGVNKKVMTNFFFELSRKIRPEYRGVIDLFSYLL